MSIKSLTPLEGRYGAITQPFGDYFSEWALIKYRVHVEVEWLIAMAANPDFAEIRPFTAEEISFLRNIVATFDDEKALRIKEIERTTNHDVKAVEYFLRETMGAMSLGDLLEFIHFSCTSEDINNLSYALMLKHGVNDVWLPSAETLVKMVSAMAEEEKDIPMLAHTHGQSASPTTIGKELAVFVYRWNRQLKQIRALEYLGKFNGAVGNFNAHSIAYPVVDWEQVSRSFVESLGLTYNPLTTQIESHDWQAELYGTISHTNRILHNLCVDVWMYISRGVFAQVPVKGATGSSTMPHKVNPIRFENAEANLEISCSLLDTLSATLVESRWQRDLTDSTTQRNIGSALGYSLLALNNLMGGLNSIHPNDVAIQAELDSNWEVLGEPIQTAMRACELAGLPGMDKPYEKVKELMRGHTINKEQVEQFIDQQSFDPETAARLKALTPATYTGVASQLVAVGR